MRLPRFLADDADLAVQRRETVRHGNIVRAQGHAEHDLGAAGVKAAVLEEQRIETAVEGDGDANGVTFPREKPSRLRSTSTRSGSASWSLTVKACVKAFMSPLARRRQAAFRSNSTGPVIIPIRSTSRSAKIFQLFQQHKGRLRLRELFP